MEMNRGDVVITAAPGDYGKPRPALVVQSDFFNPAHGSVVVCLITSHLVEAPLFRVPIQPAPGNGLRHDSQVMADKLVSLPLERIKKKAGRLSDAQMARVDEALRLWLDLGP